MHRKSGANGASRNEGHRKQIMIESHEVTQLPMMLTAIGQALCYNEIDNAKALQKLAMDWAKQPENRDAIYEKFAKVAGWTGTSSGLL